VSGGGLVLGTQTPLEFRSYPTGHLVVGGGNCPSALFKPKGSVVVNTAVNIVADNIATIAILFWFITLSIMCFIFGLGKLYSSYFKVINDMNIRVGDITEYSFSKFRWL
jgi:hypothetical protein